MRTRLERHDEQDGVISVMAAVMALAVLMATGLAVDVGRVAYVSRDQQGVTDRAALDAIDVITSAPVGTTLSAVQPMVELAVDESLARNPGSVGTAQDRDVLMVELGNVGTDRIFTVPDCTTKTCTVADVSAVRVQTTSNVPFLFAIGATDDEDPGLNARRVVKSAVAQADELASITVGSTLVGLEGGLVEDVLNNLICSTVLNSGAPTCSLDVSAVGYEGLATSQITLGDLVDELSLTTGSPDNVLTTDVTLLQFLTASANVLDASGQPDQAQVLRDIALVLPTDRLEVSLGDLVDLSTTSLTAAADAGLNVFELVKGAVQVANGDALLEIPDLGVAVPGVASVTANVKVIEAPQTAVGRAVQNPDGTWATSARTAQVRVGLDPVIGSSLFDEVEDLLGVLGTVSVSDIRLPMSLEVASAQADLTAITCPGSAPDAPDLTTLLNSDATSLLLGNVDPDTGARSPAELVNVTVTVGGLGFLGLGAATIELSVDANLDLPLGGVSDQSVTFLAEDDSDSSDASSYPRGPKTVPGAALDFGAAADALGPNQLAVVVKNVSVLGLPLGFALGPVVQAVSEGVKPLVLQALAPVIEGLDTAAIQPLLDTLGASVANSVVWANSASCSQRHLAAVIN